jgi:hypothetical protein
MSSIPDFTQTEQWVVHTTLKERYGHDKEIQLGDSEVRLNPSAMELTEVPVLYWEHADCHFVLFKVGDGRYRSQFFYRGFEQFSTGIDEYDDIGDCVVSLLRAQADHEAERGGQFPDDPG